MAYVFEIVESQPQPALWIRKLTSVDRLPQELGKAYGAIITYLTEKGVQAQGPAFTAYFNMDMESLEVEMGFPVATEMVGSGDIVAGYIPGGRKATCMFKGPYRDMGPTYEALTKWIGDNGYVPVGTVYESYYNSPTEVPESELLTKIEFLLK
ncbi:MAG TPA: GyrI-like domain-containing protein [Clostridia bacterium]|nr:GyrI-like domain-containing protein [Clostridia bacterium]